MIDLNDDNDPYLFCATTPAGKIIVQYTEVLATAQASVSADTQPTLADICEAFRKSARTPDVAQTMTDAQIIGLWQRMTMKLDKAGNG